MQKGLCGDGKFFFGVLHDADMPPGYLKIQGELDQPAVQKIGTRELIGHKPYPQVMEDCRRDQVVGVDFYIRVKLQSLFLEDIVPELSGGGPLLHAYQRILQQFFQRERVIQKMSEMIACHHNILEIGYLGDKRALLFLQGRCEQGKIQRTRHQGRDGHLGGEGVYPDIDIGITVLELLQVREQEIPHGQLAGSNIDLTALTVHILFQHPPGPFHLLAGAADLAEEKLSFRGQRDAFLGTKKKPAVQIMFQILDAFADGGLGQAKLLSRQRDIFFLRDLVKNFVLVEADVRFMFWHVIQSDHSFFLWRFLKKLIIHFFFSYYNRLRDFRQVQIA